MGATKQECLFVHWGGHGRVHFCKRLFFFFFFGKRPLLPKRPLKVCHKLPEYFTEHEKQKKKTVFGQSGKRASRIATDVHSFGSS